ncbi:MAG: sensor histidine kinase [Blastocatellia bacterium]|nr:sensor histidine kinase [Blastocatellia bacterium]
MIRAKLVVIFFVFILFPMLFLWMRWQSTAIGSIKLAMRQGLSERTREISDQITRSLQMHQARLAELARQPGLRALARTSTANSQAVPDQNLRIDLSAFLLAYQHDYSALLIIDRQGAPTFKVEPQPQPGGIIKPFYLEKGFSSDDLIGAPETIANLAADAVFVSEMQQDQTGPHLRLIAPLRDDAGNATAAIALKLRADRLMGDAVGPHILPQNNSQTPPTSEIFITSQQGLVVYASDASKEWKPYNSGDQQKFNAIRTLKDKAEDWPPRQVHHRLREESPRLSILAFENYNTAVENLKFDSVVLLLLTLLLVIVAILALYYLVSTITDSIRRVTIGAKAIATGNLGYQIKIKARDETRVLAEAFNRMAGRLREMIRKEGEQKQFESFARLSAVLTHDLKNQILSLSLLVNNMERKFDREGFKEDAMRTLSDSVNNLQNLVAKLSDPRTPTKRIRERANITHLVERVIQRTAAQAANRYSVSSELMPDVFAVVDGKAVERVVENLVINALEAMPDGGSLKIIANQENGNAVISVADTGKGMTEEFVRERLFHPFATTKKKGIGLGLYSCRDIIEQHGGRIDVASQVERGTEFKVVLPLQSETVDTGELKPVVTV